MNKDDIKYVMLPRIEDKSKIIKPQPWYKERLRDKYLNKNNNLNKEKLFDPKQWVFIKDGLDDFRDGLPPPHDELIIKPSKGPGPTLKNDSWKFKENILPAKNRLNLSQRCFSKKIPMAEMRLEHINQILNDLSKHPLSLYPHLEDGLPPELLEEIIQILDPDLNKESVSNATDSRFSFENNTISGESTKNEANNKILDQDSEMFRKNLRNELQKLEDNMTKKTTDTESKLDDKKQVRNTYKWLLKKEEAKIKTKGPEPEQIKAQAIDNHIKKVTEEFCDWVKSLGGEHNIDPVTLTSLFASGYDTKPPLSVPIHVVELSNIPAELRTNAYVPPDANSEEEIEKKIYRDVEKKIKENGFRYGAWYLPKEHWKKMPVNEKLIDPKVKNDIEKQESKKRAEDINARLAPLHGAQSFKNFIKSKKKPERVPKLIEELEEWEFEQASKLASAMTNSNNNITSINNINNNANKN